MDLNCNYVVGRADGCRMVKIGAEFSKEERNVSLLAGGGRINMMYVPFLIIALASMSINSIK